MTTVTQDLLALDEDAQNLLFREARTANAFTDEPVSDEQIEAIFDLVKWAPTSMNSQPLRVVIVRSEEAKARLVPLMAEGNQAKVAAAPAVALLAADIDFHEEMPKLFPPFPGARDMFDADEASRASSAELNAGLQIGYAIIGIRAAGLAAGPMTGMDADAISKEFFPDGRHRVLVAINMGKPADNAWYDRLPRLEQDEVVETL
ncbi:malonic semialdehyde reductase [Corynebacterium glutamicum]|uniref:Malonic semialdehyde reductase n=1 Tax=Corynebacterium glutamicum TaxID=1718 RepID=A0AB36IHE0_CORGT|nr:malonic semialdehyde reductase [Corynebacterium glutamicum]AGN20524.1 malonic semialdehyde reductase [Corynebacterium glutamicum SCgG1]AGN23549.1 malonic semialdehyde reductase [Corynebacterium glutamicum SCgG2]EGV41110.1 malonic semialdehyde reductase [Corynebacterium glutamicum S9114]EOA64078.1 malonic semialdehyde reductase [Corynebacterium glutamicum MT]EPP39240.1 malonic semialdehyde reductase [Corynebacterium glutamicum Z188]